MFFSFKRLILKQFGQFPGLFNHCIMYFKMSIPVLTTKLFIPPVRSNAVPRSRLVKKLAAGLSQPGCFILLSGPAGFGKTTLLSELAVRLDQKVAWLSLDEGDNDPVRFWTYLIAACRTNGERIGDAALSLLQTAQQLPVEVVPGILINDLAVFSRSLVLILDDFHTVQNEMIHKSFTYLLEHAPGNLHVVISTRVDPPWPLARFRARNQLVEVRVQDLRFRQDEAEAFLNRTMNLPLSDQEVASLTARTEGWVAGMQLAALSMQGRNNPSSFVKAFTGSNVYVAEYLVEEILLHQAEEIQSFLLKTSILDRLSGGLCDAVMGRQDGKIMLENLYRENLFVLPLDDERLWFRYHQLFADLLRARLQSDFPQEAVVALHQRAASWYEQNGFVAEAVNHVLAVRDFESAARLFEQYGSQMMTRGELATFLSWTDALPDEVIVRHPQIIIAKVWALTLAGEYRLVEPILKLAESYTGSKCDTPETCELVGFTAAIRAFFAMMAGEDDIALQLAERAEGLLPERSVHVRWLLPYTIGAAYRGRGQFEKAVEAFQRQAQMGEAHDNLIVWVTGVTGVALVRRAQGSLREVVQICHQALRRLDAYEAAGFGSLAKLETPLIEVLIEQNELDEAQRRLEGVTARMQNWPMPTDRLHSLLALIQLQTAQGDLIGALETLRVAKELKSNHAVLMNLARLVDLWEIRLFIEAGEFTSADRLLEALQPGTSRWVELRDYELLLLANLRLAQSRPNESQKILSPLVEELEVSERKPALIEALALQAYVWNEQKDRDTALSFFIKALDLAEPEGFVQVFLKFGKPMHQLLAMLSHHQFLETNQRRAYYVDKLSNAVGGRNVEQFEPPGPSGSVSGLVEPLTGREIEVLHLIAAGDSNRTIAKKLVITESAVKKHTGNIYGKLSVNSRTQAVASARQLGILSEQN
ncbi:MAG: hypothetical protein CL609_22000 [Anaerolineaceae bacterium]|nr:hypothetical protein [Anaerolineaceae bacterium]